jgi:hypothetical protein
VDSGQLLFAVVAAALREQHERLAPAGLPEFESGLYLPDKPALKRRKKLQKRMA